MIARVLLAAVLIAAGAAACGSTVDLDKVMGRNVEGTPVQQPQKLHCDLIFPGGDTR